MRWVVDFRLEATDGAESFHKTDFWAGSIMKVGGMIEQFEKELLAKDDNLRKVTILNVSITS